jgi:hypothetical protein
MTSVEDRGCARRGPEYGRARLVWIQKELSPVNS